MNELINYFWFAPILTFLLFYPLITPKKINGLYGYRTTNSQKSQIHWKFAQKFSARFSSILSAILLPFYILFYQLGISRGELYVFISWIVGTVIMIILTEKRLKKIEID